MTTRQQQERRPDPPLERRRKQYHKTRWLIVSITLVFIAAGASVWILTNRSSFTTILPILIFSILGVLISLFQWLFPFSLSPFEHHAAQPNAPLETHNAEVAHHIQPIIVHIPMHQALIETLSTPTISLYRRIVGFPPITDPRTIQQREHVVKTIYTQLTKKDISAIALTGIGGAGKSTLAALLYQYAEEQRARQSEPFKSETLWLTVDPTVSFTDLVGNLFEALGRPIPDLRNLAPHNQALMLFNALNTTDEPRLIIFDQFENLLNWDTGLALTDRPGVGEWIDILNSQQCTCRILLTSRPRPSGTRDYPPTFLQEYPVQGLEIAEGIALLQNRGVSGTEEELQAAVAYCKGHAFSLSLLASLVHDHTISLSSLLRDPLLWIGNIARNFLDYIYSSQLNQAQRELLLAFSVYREPVLLEAAEAIITDISRTQVMDAVKSLRVQHLIEPTGEGHYQLHAIISEYAQGHFDESSELANTEARKARHLRAAHYYQHIAETNTPPISERRQAIEIHDFIEAIWQYCQADQQQEAYNIIEQEKILICLRRWSSNAILLEICLLLQPRDTWQTTSKQSATINRYMGWAYNALGKEKLAREHFEQSLHLYSATGDLEGQREVLDHLGWSYHRLGQWNQSMVYYERALAICQERGDRQGEGHALNGLGKNYGVLGKKIQALECYEQALAISKEIGNLSLEGRTLISLGSVHIDLGNYLKALEYLERSLAIRKSLGDRRGEGVALDSIGRVYNEMGQLEKAEHYFSMALSIYQTIGDRGLEGWILHNLGWTYNRLGQYEKAKTYLEQALFIHQEVGNRRGECRTTRDLGKSSRMLGQKKQAFVYYQQALNISEEIQDPFGKATTLQNAAMLYIDQTQYEEALSCLLIAKNIFDEILSPYSKDTQKSIDTLHKTIGEEQFTALVTQVEPQAQQIVDQALRETDSK